LCNDGFYELIFFDFHLWELKSNLKTDASKEAQSIPVAIGIRRHQ
jgi:hypothetical protein